MFQRWENIYILDNSVCVVKGFLEYSLPSPMKEQMKLVRQHLNKKINKLTGILRDELEVARSNHQTIKNLVTKMFLQLRKQYGQDIPKFTNKAPPTPVLKAKESRRSIEDSPKINTVIERKRMLLN